MELRLGFHICFALSLLMTVYDTIVTSKSLVIYVARGVCLSRPVLPPTPNATCMQARWGLQMCAMAEGDGLHHALAGPIARCFCRRSSPVPTFTHSLTQYMFLLPRLSNDFCSLSSLRPSYPILPLRPSRLILFIPPSSSLYLRRPHLLPSGVHLLTQFFFPD